MAENGFLKVTNAVYKVLDYLPDADPLKNKAKEKALAILENATLLSGAQGWVSLKSYFTGEHEKASAQLLGDIEVLEGYLGIGKNQGWIDSMNFLIITREYQNIKNSFKKSETKKGVEVSAVQHPIADVGQPIKERPAKKEDFSDRQRKILEILKKKEKAQVADLIKELPDITKRTVRRDLDDLLKKGKIARVGEWNQVFYQIA